MSAARAVIRPDDVGSLGAYSLAAASGVMGAGLASAAPVFSFRYGGVNTAILKRALLTAVNAGTAFSAGTCAFDLIVARAFTASDSGGASVLPTTGNKLATTMANTGVTDIRIASTGTLTPGTRNLDSQSIAKIIAPAPITTVNYALVGPQASLLDRRVGDWPLVLAYNEGFVIQATMPATGTWTFAIQIDWEELSTYGAGLAT
jgi:hypothetical protein